MSTIYIDTEFNGFDGNLISIGAVAHWRDGDDDRTREFYGVLQPVPGDKPIPWVVQNVIPVLWPDGKGWRSTTTLEGLRAGWQNWVKSVANEAGMVEIVADWFEDLAWAARLLVNPEGKQVHPKFVRGFTCVYTGNIDLKPEVRHNALHDARALARWHRAILAKGIS